MRAAQGGTFLWAAKPAASGSGWTWGVYGATPVAAISETGDMEIAGRFKGGGGTPTFSSCGTSPSVSGTDSGGIVTTGSPDGNFCAINFAEHYSVAPACVVSMVGSLNDRALLVSSISTTGFTVFNGTTPFNGGQFSYVCVGN